MRRTLRFARMDDNDVRQPAYESLLPFSLLQEVETSQKEPSRTASKPLRLWGPETRQHAIGDQVQARFLGCCAEFSRKPRLPQVSPRTIESQLHNGGETAARLSL